MNIVDTAEAHIWRSQMLRLLTLPPQDSATEPLLPHQMKQKSARLATELLNGPAQLLLNSTMDYTCREKRDKELFRLYNIAGELSLCLWSHRAFLECHSLSSLPQFDTNNPSMTLHRLQQPEENQRKLNGKRVLAVIQPAIVAFGNEDAENYDKLKVWSEAVVLVDERL